MKALAFLTAALLSFTMSAHAEPAFVTKDGYITISGEVLDVSRSRNDFTIQYNDRNISVSMDDIDEDTLNQLIESDIIAQGSYVTVTGKMEDEISGPVIKANAINIYSQPENTNTMDQKER